VLILCERKTFFKNRNKNFLLRHSRYPFQCASVSYFGDERDCVLNLQNRQSAPEQFTPEPDQQVFGELFLKTSI